MIEPMPRDRDRRPFSGAWALVALPASILAVAAPVAGAVAIGFLLILAGLTR